MMFGKGFHLFTLFGFKVEADWSWLIIAFLITWSLAVGYFPYFHPDLSPATYWTMGLIGALGLFASIVLHELSHSLVARRYGLEMRGIRLFVFGGVAEMDEEPENPTAEFMMAAAGPLASVVISVMAFGLYVLSVQWGWNVPTRAVVLYLAWINAVLVVFNLVPAFPLDGGRIFRSILWQLGGDLRWATRVATYSGTAFAFFLMALGVLSFIGGNFIGGMWWILLGLFLRAASESSYRQMLVRRVLGSEPVRHLMRTEIHTVPASISIQELVEEHIYRHHHKMFPVTENGHLLGCITTRKIKEVPRDQWSRHTVGEFIERCSDKNSVAPETDAMRALQKMTGEGQSRLLVVEGDQLRGVITLKDVSQLISLKLELGEDK